jgi:hypothetical protein
MKHGTKKLKTKTDSQRVEREQNFEQLIHAEWIANTKHEAKVIIAWWCFLCSEAEIN